MMQLNRVSRIFMLIMLTLLSTEPLNAGGILGDAIESVCGNCGAGKALDDAHRQVKEAVPPYKALEEGASKVVNETLVQTTAPLLQELIASSRDDAIDAGVEPIPQEIKRNLLGFIPEQILNGAMYRVRGGGDLSLQVNSIRYGEANAITLDYVIVFKDEKDALYNPTLWAHELTHVQQYQNWGLKDFAIRYVRNYRDVEAPAYEAETRYAAWVGVQNAQKWAGSQNNINPGMINQPLSAFSFNENSNTCGTAVAVCSVNGFAPVGTPCWCNTPLGAATGSLIPSHTQQTQFPPHAPSGLQSGYGMRVCGCWGPNPRPTASEPRCASGQVRINICQGFCVPGHPLYSYICM